MKRSTPGDKKLKKKEMSSYNLKTSCGGEPSGGCRLVGVKHLLPADQSTSSGRMVQLHPAGITVRKSAAAQRKRIWICQRQSDIWLDCGASVGGSVQQVNEILPSIRNYGPISINSRSDCSPLNGAHAP